MSHGCARIDTNTQNISAYQCNQWAIMSHRPAQMDTDTRDISVDQCNQWENIILVSVHFRVVQWPTYTPWNAFSKQNRTKMRFFLHICKKMCTFAR